MIIPWVIIHVPHSSRLIPDEYRSSYLLNDTELERELDLLTDHFTDTLFDINLPEVVSLVFPVSRFLVDPERFVLNREEPMAARGQGGTLREDHTREAVTERHTRHHPN